MFQIESFAPIFSTRTSRRNLDPYLMKIFLSQLVFDDHPLFTLEDIAASQVKKLYSEYYNLVNTQAVRYLKKRIEVQKEQLVHFNKVKNPTVHVKSEIESLEKQIAENEVLIKDHKSSISEKALELYEKWLEVKRLRTEQNFSTSDVKLLAMSFKNEDGKSEFGFVLQSTEPTLDPASLSLNEKERRKKLQKSWAIISLYINNVFVCSSERFKLNWPSFNLTCDKIFQVSMFTKPTLIEFEITLDTKESYRFQIDVPGLFARTITSSASLFEVIDFDNGVLAKANIKEKSELKPEIDKEKKEEEIQEGSNSNLVVKREEEKKEPKEVKLRNSYSIAGRVYLKAEWERMSADMPPVTLESKLNMVNEHRKYKEEIQQIHDYDFPIDINDPRNSFMISEIKKLKTDQMLKYFNKEFLVPFNSVVSLRQYILKKRNESSALYYHSVPLLEDEIRKDIKLMSFVKLFKEDEKKIPLSEKEQVEYVRERLKEINAKFSGRVLSEDEYADMIMQKIRLIKKDTKHRVLQSYPKVVSEMAVPKIINIKKMIQNVNFKKHKLKPKPKKQTKISIGSVEELTISVQIVKGYNIPIRNTALQNNLKEKLKRQAIDNMYKAGRNMNIFNSGFNQVNQMQPYNMNRGNVYSPNNTNQNVSNISYNDVNPNLPPNFNNQNLSPPIFPAQPTFPEARDPRFNPNSAAYNFPGNGDPRFGNNGVSDPRYAQMQYSGYEKNNQAYYNPNMQNKFDNVQNDIVQLVDLLKQQNENVTSFVEVQLVDEENLETARTNGVEGTHPDYNFKTVFTLKPPEGKTVFSDNDILKSKSCFFFNLYDEIKKEERLFEKGADKFIYRYIKRYLGSFQIPLSTILMNSTALDSFCKVEVPLSVYGYCTDNAKDIEDAVGLSSEAIESRKIIDPNVNTYVSVYISINPLMKIFDTDDIDYVPGFEDPTFLLNSSRWLKSKKALATLKKRYVRLYAENFDGFSVFICRFIHPLKPPETVLDEVNNLNDDLAIERAARFVSLIPFVEDIHAFEDMPDCWCTNEQVFYLGFGDYEEHALVLCNMFNYIDQKQGRNAKSYIVLGKAHPEGWSTYVLRVSKDTPDYEIWDSVKGDCYHIDKRFSISTFLCIPVGKTYDENDDGMNKICPLKEITCIIGDDNVYLNVGVETDPYTIDYNFANASQWAAFLKYFTN